MKLIHITTLAAMSIGLASCTTTQSVEGQQAMNKDTHTVEFLYFDGCPNTPPFRGSLESALDQTDGYEALTPIDMTTLAEDDIRRGYGSPTILVDGRDLFGAGVPDSSMMRCRIYAGGTPDSEAMAAKLSELTR
ncbi:MAG: hypothetical protein JKY43_03665 [Phycisphaerales bacterium]|nr:hypothetical protein [Phycisphaerales bacterium]